MCTQWHAKCTKCISVRIHKHILTKINPHCHMWIFCHRCFQDLSLRNRRSEASHRMEGAMKQAGSKTTETAHRHIMNEEDASHKFQSFYLWEWCPGRICPVAHLERHHILVRCAPITGHAKHQMNLLHLWIFHSSVSHYSSCNSDHGSIFEESTDGHLQPASDQQAGQRKTF